MQVLSYHTTRRHRTHYTVYHVVPGGLCGTTTTLSCSMYTAEYISCDSGINLVVYTNEFSVVMHLEVEQSTCAVIGCGT